MAQLIYDAVKSYGIENRVRSLLLVRTFIQCFSQVFGVAGDNASNVDAMVVALGELIGAGGMNMGGQTQIRCFGHILNLIMQVC